VTLSRAGELCVRESKPVWVYFVRFTKQNIQTGYWSSSDRYSLGRVTFRNSFNTNLYAHIGHP
jgi:hypothetical protein